MKTFMIMAMVASATIASVAVSSQAQAGYKNDYGTQYCQYYKNKAVWTGEQRWWNAYYACMEDNR